MEIIRKTVRTGKYGVKYLEYTQDNTVYPLCPLLKSKYCTKDCAWFGIKLDKDQQPIALCKETSIGKIKEKSNDE